MVFICTDSHNRAAFIDVPVVFTNTAVAASTCILFGVTCVILIQLKNDGWGHL